MPEGIASIAEMQVVVDTNAEKFGQSMEAMRSVVANFAGEGTRHLAFFDAGVLKMGASIDAIKARLGIWLQVAEMALNLIANFDQHATSIAGKLGYEAEYQAIRGAVIDLAEAVQQGLAGAYEKAKGSVTAYASSLVTTREQQAAAASSGETMGQSVRNTFVEMSDGARRFAEFMSKPENWSLQTLLDGIGEVAQAFRRMTDPSGWSSDALGREIAATEERILRLTAITNGAMDGDTSFIGRLLGLDEAEAGQARLAKLTERLDELRQARAAAYAAEVAAGDSKLSAMIKSETDALDRQITTYGMAKDEIAAYNVAKKITEELAKKGQTLSEAEAEALANVTDEIKRKANALRDLELSDVSRKSVEGLAREAEAMERKITMMGLAKEEGIVYAAVMKVIDELTARGATLTGAQAEALANYADKIRAAAATIAGIEKANAGTRELDAIREKARELQLREQSIGLSKVEAQQMKELADLEAKIASGKVSMSAAQRAEAERLIAQRANATQRLESAAHAEKEEAAVEKLLATGEREIEQLNAKTRALGMSAGEAARLSMEEKLLAQARSQNINLDASELAVIQRIAEGYGRAAQAQQELQAALNYTKEAGNIAAKGLETVFKNWMNNTKTDTKELVRSMLADLAMLTFRRGVTEPLVGMFTQGMGSLMNGGGLFGGAGAPSFGGFRAAGGPVDSGVPYVVGERGPELFVPRSAGMVLPKVLGGAAPLAVYITNRIDAAGAYPESIADIRRALAEQSAEMPGKVIEVIRDTRERGLG